MNSKLLILCASLALAAAASLPHRSAVGDLHEAVAFDDGLYLPVLGGEQELQRLPRASVRPKAILLRRRYGPTLAFKHNDQSNNKNWNPFSVRYHNSRVARSVESNLPFDHVFEVPLTYEHLVKLERLQDVLELEDPADDSTHLGHGTDAEEHEVIPPFVSSVLRN